MREVITLAAALTTLSVIPAGAAHAEGWCGYPAREKAMIECGYSSANECESAMGKGGMCFVDPDYALNWKARSAMPRIASAHSRNSGNPGTPVIFW